MRAIAETFLTWHIISSAMSPLVKLIIMQLN